MLSPKQWIYSRTIDVHRARTVAGGTPNIGLTSYSGMAQANVSAAMGEDVIATGIPCSIQDQGMGRVKGQGLLPSDAPGPGQWKCYIPFEGAAKGSIKDRDILVDDEGVRYQVSQASWDRLGWRIVCIRLES